MLHDIYFYLLLFLFLRFLYAPYYFHAMSYDARCASIPVSPPPLCAILNIGEEKMHITALTGAVYHQEARAQCRYPSSTLRHSDATMLFFGHSDV